ncbi:MAG: acyl-CoA carboxylase subunit beta [Brevefilum sp.]
MTKVDPRIEQLREMRAKVQQGGGQDRIDRQHAKGKLTARERLDLLLDENSFVELEPFTTQKDDPDQKACLGDGVVTGFGTIEDRTVYVYAQDFTVQGGALGELHSRKICRAMDLAVANGCPIIGLIDSGGARIQEGVKSLGGYAEIFKRNARYSGVVPQISLILGPCAGGAAYSPALTDIIIMVEKQSFMFLTGPQVIKTVTGEETDFESLGGAEVHLTQSGTAHLMTKDEEAALKLTRYVVGYLPSNHVDNPPVTDSADDPERLSESLNSLVPVDPGTPYSMHAAIDEVVDQGTFLELQAGFARNAIVGLARMDGMPVGIIAQEPGVMAGVIDIDAADKICRMVRFCDAFNLPLITFVDSPGFLPGVSQEHGGIIRHGAKVLYAYSEANVPKVSIVTRKAYGGAYVVMSSKYLGTDINLAWPSAEIAVMGPKGATNILYRKELANAEDPEAERQRLETEYRQKYLTPYAAANAGYVDDVIEPAETRRVVIKALRAIRQKAETHPPRKHGNMPV